MEQKDERYKTRMREMENEEGWLKCVMFNGSSWGTVKAFQEGMRAELDVLWALSTD